VWGGAEPRRGHQREQGCVRVGYVGCVVVVVVARIMLTSCQRAASWAGRLSERRARSDPDPSVRPTNDLRDSQL